MKANESFLRALFSMETGHECRQLLHVSGMKYIVIDEDGNKHEVRA